METSKIAKKIGYLILMHLFVFGAILAIKSVDAEDEPIYRDGVCIDHCEEEDDEDDEDDEEDESDSESEEKEEKETINKTYTIVEPARTVTNTTMKTKVIIDTDQDGIRDENDPHPDIAEIYVVGDEDRNGIADWLEK